MKIKEIKIGAICSYLLIFLNTLYGLLFTPFLISKLGDSEYGVYKIIASLVGSITILDLGVGSTVLRYIAKFYAKKDKEGISNFSAMGFIQAAVLSMAMVIVCIVIYTGIDGLYGGSLTVKELEKAKSLFVLFSIILVLNTFEKVIFNIIAGCEHFAFANSLKLLRLILKVGISIVILLQISDSRVLLLIDLTILILFIVVQLIYIRYKIKIKIRLKKWESALFKSSLKYTLLMFLQSVAVQFNGNLDSMVIGAVEGAVSVAVYSIGLQLFNMYEQFAMAFSDLMLPTVSKQIEEGASNKELEDTVIKVGRLEFAALGAALCGYIIIGREFISLWLGETYLFAWLVGLILMIPITIPLIQNVSLSILRAKNKMTFRTIVVCIMAIFNLIITIVGVRIFGAIAACIGTAISLIAANIIAMNIYYVKVIKLNIFRIFKNILSRTWLCCMISSAVLLVADYFLQGDWVMWGIKVVIFLVIYATTMLLFGFNKKEKQVILGKLLRLKMGKRHEN